MFLQVARTWGSGPCVPGAGIFPVRGVADPVHIIGQTSRHAGPADILREQLDGGVGKSEQRSAAFQEYDADHRAGKHAKVEQAAIAADPAQA